MTALLAAVFLLSQLLCQLLLTVECVDDEPPSGYVWNPEDKTFYKIHPEKKTWEAAQQACLEEHANLAVADTSKKIKHIQNLGSGMTNIWIGIHRPSGTVGGAWFRVGTGPRIRFLLWDSSNDNKDYNCASTSNVNGKIIKLSCAQKHQFVCAVAGGPCPITIQKGLPSPQPLILRPTRSGGGFRIPDDTVGTLRFTAREDVRLVCTGTDNKFVNLAGTQRDVIATCVNGNIFSVSGVLIPFSKLACSFLPSPEERTKSKACLSGQYTEVKLGFALSNEFLTIIYACHNESSHETLYTKFTLVKEIRGYQSGFLRANNWDEGSMANLNSKNLYIRGTQITTIKKLLGPEQGARYILQSGDYFFSRGHLVAKADFLYGSQQEATFHYVNTAPQWQIFNGGNWNALENDIRAFASGGRQDLTVYTGVHGIAQLPNARNDPIDLYLSVDSNGLRSIPIPKFFWKVIYNEKTKLGTAFVGVNNPYLIHPVTKDYHLCDDISTDIGTLTWEANVKDRGIFYACTVDSLREVVKTIPSFKVTGILGWRLPRNNP